MCLNPKIAGLQESFSVDGELVKKVTFRIGDQEIVKSIRVPCRSCVECVIGYSNQWATRVAAEASCHRENCFITLTYNDENLPKDNQVAVREVQLFLKRLRKSLGKKRIRYFACGEYGEKGGRPHYHVIIFGHSFSDRYFLKFDNRKNPIYRSPSLEKLWTKGFSSVGEVNRDSARYAAKYMQKFMPVGERKPAFTLQSRKPAIGYVYAIKHYNEIVKTCGIYQEGKKRSLPPVFKRWYKREGLNIAPIEDAMALRTFPSAHEEDLVARRLNFVNKFGFWRKNRKGELISDVYNI